jgi:hypothetical protein
MNVKMPPAGNNTPFVSAHRCREIFSSPVSPHFLEEISQFREKPGERNFGRKSLSSEGRRRKLERCPVTRVHHRQANLLGLGS